jgi:purine-cytosine permease-like protein
MLSSNPDPLYHFATVYDDRGIGGLVGAVFNGHGTRVRGFGRFIEVLLALSITGANISNMYSLGINIRAASSWTQRISRIIVTLFGFSVALTRVLHSTRSFRGSVAKFHEYSILLVGD